MIFTEEPIKWESDDAKTLRDFLDSSVGLRAIATLSQQTPALLDGGDVNKTLVRNGEAKGYTAALKGLMGLCVEQPEQPKQSEAYPSLDDDSKWTETTEQPTT